MIALDLFAGTGWGVACQALGIEEYGVEIMPEAIATRKANGMETIYADVWDGLLGTGGDYPFMAMDAVQALRYDLLIASPPCQTFSAAGSGTGRKALDHVYEAIHSGAYQRPNELRAFGDAHDPRTALVLTPLAHVYRDSPRLVVWEQVPPVLPVWELAAEKMREWGYSVVTGILNAEQYGVPQTRKRAILIARWDGEARMPTATHSRYYPRDPSRLDPGVLPWVSMAEALGWGRTARPSVTVTGGGTETGGAEPLGHLSREVAAADWVMRSNYGTSGDPEKRGEREAAQPAPTMTSKADRNFFMERHRGAGMLERHGERKGRPVDEPALTVTGNASGTTPGGFRIVNLDPAKPATTVAGEPRLSSREHHYHGEQNSMSTRVTIDEAALLQSYPPGFTFAGTKGKQFLQVGNAVPPRLAEAILSTLI